MIAYRVSCVVLLTLLLAAGCDGSATPPRASAVLPNGGTSQCLPSDGGPSDGRPCRVTASGGSFGQAAGRRPAGNASAPRPS